MSRSAISARFLTAIRARARLGLLVVVAIAWGGAAWLIAEQLSFARSARLIEREQGVASASASSLAASVGYTLAHMRNIPKVLARQPEIEAILSRIGPDVQRNKRALPAYRAMLAERREYSLLAKRLEAMVAELGVDQIWVMNAAGDCIVSGGFPRGTAATGVNYLDREYFWRAKRTGLGRQFAVGRTTDTPGIFYSAAVTVNQRFLGVIAVKIDVTRLAQLFNDSNTFITDENGVVIIAGDAGLLMKAIPGAAVGALPENVRLNRYKKLEFPVLAIDPLDLAGFRLFRLGGRSAPMVEAASDSLADILRIRVFREVSEWPGIRNEARSLFLLLLFAGWVVIASVGAAINYLRRGQEHQAEVARVNAELVKLNDELRVQARFDSLTGCSNRRHFLEELDNELKRSARFAFSCSLAVLDIDHFKDVNDQYGHAAGDALLKHFVHTVGQSLRASDLLGRLGGEEFALLMPQTTLAGAVKLAERVRSAVESSCARAGRLEVNFSVSIGVEQWRAGDDNVESLVARADQAMYEAKRYGRNRVHFELASGHQDRLDEAPLAVAQGLSP